jgi:hypothetical protein
VDLLKKLLGIATAKDAPPPGEQRVAAVYTALVEAAGPDVDLAELDGGAVERFNELYADGDYRPADADTLEALADVTEAVRRLKLERDQERVERDQRVSALADRVQSPAEPVQDPAGEGQQPGGQGAREAGQVAPDGLPEATPHPAEGPGGAGAAAQRAEPAPGSQSTARGGDAPAAPTVDPPQTAEPATDVLPVAASAPPPPVPRRTPTAAAVASGRGAPPADPAPARITRSYSITASAENTDFTFGQQLTVRELGEAACARFAALPVGQAASAPIKANVARITRHFAEDRRLMGDNRDIRTLDDVADERRLPGGSLVAAVQRALTAADTAPSTINDVWCTPSETDYTLCPPMATDDGMLDLPTTGMPARGGIRFPQWTQYPDQSADATRNGWHGTAITYPAAPASPGAGLDNPTYFHHAADDTPPGDGLGNVKMSITGPCVTWREVRASLAYLSIESDILRDRTFPEGQERFASDVLVHHNHFMNSTYLAYIGANSDVLPAFSVSGADTATGSVAVEAVDRLRLLLVWFRNRYKMAPNATLEVVLPEWFKDFVKRDLELKRNRPFGAVADAEVAALFAQYSSRVQWVRDWQELGDGAAVGGRIMPPAGWPTTVNIMAYPAGSWVLSQGNVLTLGVQYDAQLLQENKYSSSFTEDAWMLINRCNRTFLVQLTDLCTNGAVGPARDICPPPTAGLVNISSGNTGETADSTRNIVVSPTPADDPATGDRVDSGDAAADADAQTGNDGGDGDGGGPAKAATTRPTNRRGK